jgi:hypothetical protein
LLQTVPVPPPLASQPNRSAHVIHEKHADFFVVVLRAQSFCEQEGRSNTLRWSNFLAHYFTVLSWINALQNAL